MENPHLPWFNRPPRYLNRAVHPENRHYSQIYTKPKAAMGYSDYYPDSQLKICRNKLDAHPQLLMTLVDVKNLFVRQLPNMGSCYITRLVFDLNAESVAILHEGVVTAAISSRLFPDQGFIEIVFLAVDSNHQDRGYGRFVMAFLKSVIQSQGMHDILTCADNEAVVYFKKQGFDEKEIRFEPEKWLGYIKDYDGVTLVHCKIHPEIDYMEYDSILKKQLNFLARKTGFQISQPFPEFDQDIPSLPHAVVNLSLSLPYIVQKCAPNVKTEGIPKLLENYDEKMETIRNKLDRIHQNLMADTKNAEVFYRPVTDEIAPDYYDHIDSPMDLWSIKNRLTKFEDYYKRPEIFATDITLMCKNCKTFNPPDTVFYKNAVEIYRKFKRLYLEEFPNAVLPDF
ncbi:Histone acetyltransferase gcn5 [Tritrichomonas foetus]|uniref:histone acetyltransferase n=1 Tax=Tritrichomonas foetus TaxID=1144522 RepID=A0A1J4J7Q9_9EUKA|nr:Histone acetyltransferase gcn5 [Tritrichomonas foetus]|eukprot:OHS95238.1 Histone acetyltransferase gcn5 [Tritrichomonas foetus]